MEQPITEARCALHPDRRAQGTCKRCGNYACAECTAGGFTAGTLCVTCDRTSAQSRYHVVPMWRFVLLSVLTLGSYELYWFWRNWQRIKRADGSDIWPFVRALFGGVTYFSLLSDINLQLATRNQSRRLSTGLAIGFLITAGVLWRLPDPYWLLSNTSVVFLIPAASAMRGLASEAALAENAPWRVRHTLLMLFAVPFFALAMIGALMPAEGGAP